ncbi:MAG TPA: alkaline phosphatase family protein [Rhizomicrobium sp.]|jgi:phospholipase C|nr:alkaline phosphatase family protein [Rhizomicrobium sp.]
MTDIKRRDFLQAAAAASALSAVGTPAEAIAKRATPAKLSDIDHFIVLMKENRSFDHYYGSLNGVRGFDDAAAGSVFRQADALNPQGHILPFRLDTKKTNAQRLYDLDHSWEGQHAAWNNGRMDNWVPTHRRIDGESGPLTMGYHTREDIPFYYALADAFTICDGYHCSMFGPTNPNRYYLMTASIDADGKAGGPALDNNGRHYSWETYPERLERAGISWRVYHEEDDYDCNILKYFTQYQKAPANSALYENALRDRPLYELLWDIRHGNIPQVSWIVPASYLSEHPDYLPAAGEHHTHQILRALWANPTLWAKTALIVNYDENDGLFDHVAPPVPPPGTEGEFVGGLPVGLGFRVPCLVISPFSRGGYVASQTFDHTSTLRLLETRFGVEVPNLSKWRREATGDLTSAFGFGHAPRFDVPKLPETEKALAVAEADAMASGRPGVPAAQVMPRQESGVRPRRA